MNTKEKLIQTASRLFQLQGYHGTGVKQIVEESHSPKGSLYYYFPGGKEQLAIESVYATAQFIRINIQENLNKEDDPTKAIQSFIYKIAEIFQKQFRLEGVPIASVALETSLISEPLRKACQEAYISFQHQFTEKLIQAKVAQNRACELGIVINSMIEGAFLLSFTMDSAEPLLLVAEQIPLLLQQCH
ncbi:MAG: TetR/AcrR family transcriptional regulator [Virgibacillus sp.]|nr:TetR/AcrR family transcriptional regulator [Virgibacillus sp.]